MMNMRYAEDHKQATKAKVLKAAARAIRQNGPDRVAVAGIMADVGLTHGGFYAHFASKDDLLAQAIGQMFVESMASWETVAGGRPLREALTAYLDFYLSTTHRDRRDRGCPLPALSADLPRLPPPSREAFGRGVASLTARLAEGLAGAGCAEAGTLASSVLSQMVGAVALARAVADPAQSDRLLDAARSAIRAQTGV
jgi:TetR/AcrR family transcriptional repressor of nem operon